ncbi:MAG TPA: alpha-amylase [Bacteroidales bacterium]|nr:alpha-amylase [Bacteroidales bacterium]
MKKIASFLLFVTLFCFTSKASNPNPPEWAKNVIWYQIFVERFHNGDPINDPTPANTTVEDMKIFPPEGWQISDWISNWFERQPWERDSTQGFNAVIQARRYGGDLQGVLDKLDYLEDLGITAVYFNPINDAPSLHKYDARNYHHIDVNFGPDPEGDIKIIASEDPNDPTTWKWTSADKMFLKLVDEFHKRGIRVILDYSWNHTGTKFWAWQDILKNQGNSAYKDWYEIASFDNPATPENEFKYNGWGGYLYLPELKKVDITTKRNHGLPYEGNIHEGPKKHIFDVTKRWLAPDGDISKGIDGYRLDVADQIGLGFWRDYRTFVKSINPDAYLVGEIWWEKWPDKMMDPAPYMQGDMFDAVMFYQVYKPARDFFNNTETEITASQLRDSLEWQWNNIPDKNEYAMMNVAASHDAPRLLSDFYNKNRYKYKPNPEENPDYKTGKPDKEAYKRLNLYLVHAFTTLGSPHIWNGDEMGMWGADDPNCRKPLMWKEMKFEKEYRNNIQEGKKEYDKLKFNKKQFAFYKKLINIRKENPVLAFGEFNFLVSEGKKLAYSRTDGKDEIIVIFNLENKTEKFFIPEGKYKDLLTGKTYKKPNVKLKSMKALILKREK